MLKTLLYLYNQWLSIILGDMVPKKTIDLLEIMFVVI